MPGTLGPALFAKLQSDSPVRLLVGTRVEAGTIDATTRGYPRICYVLDDEVRVNSYAGYSGLSNQLLTVACIGRTFASADDLAAAVRAAIELRTGVAATWGELVVRASFFRGKRTSVEEVAELQPGGTLYVTELDFQVWFEGE